MSAKPAELSGLARPVTGPSALGGDVRRFLNLTRALAVTEFKLRFFGSVLGYLWQLMRPLMLFGVLYVVFTQFVRLGGGESPPHFPVVLLSGIVLYTFFAEATGSAVTCVVDRENLVRKIHFPRLAIPLSVVLVALFNLVLNLIVVSLFLAASGVDVRLSWLEAPLLVLALAVLSVGTAMALAALFVRFRDVKPIWDVMLQVLFYTSPILYPLELVAEKGGEQVQQALMLSPVGAILQEFRHAVIDPGAMSAAEAAGGWEWLLVPGGIVVGIFGLGFWIFNREAPRVAEEL